MEFKNAKIIIRTQHELESLIKIFDWYYGHKSKIKHKINECFQWIETFYDGYLIWMDDFDSRNYDSCTKRKIYSCEIISRYSFVLKETPFKKGGIIPRSTQNNAEICLENSHMQLGIGKAFKESIKAGKELNKAIKAMDILNGGNSKKININWDGFKPTLQQRLKEIKEKHKQNDKDHQRIITAFKAAYEAARIMVSIFGAKTKYDLTGTIRIPKTY